MSDIVERLGQMRASIFDKDWRSAMADAADEIERLRAEASRIANNNAHLAPLVMEIEQQAARIQELEARLLEAIARHALKGGGE